MKQLIPLCALLAGIGSLAAADLKTKNVFLISTDGLRWQEVFSGAEEALLNKANGGVVNPSATRAKFWRNTPEERRRTLMPFFWSEIASRGQLFGNQTKGSIAQLANDKKFSYPGYSEFLTGVADPCLNSNDKIPNPNTNVFEWLNLQPRFAGRVAAAVNWDVVPWILNVERSHLAVWSGFSLPSGAPVLFTPSTELRQWINDTPALWDNMLFDALTFRVAWDYIQTKQPSAFYLSFSEVDEWAHEGRYDLMLAAAHYQDDFIRRLWEMVQSIPAYRNQTTFIITTDHGRGDAPQAWRSHGASVQGAENIWIGVLGPDTPPLGERTNCAKVTLSQVAATVAAFLGEDFPAAMPQAAPPLPDVLPQTSN